MEISTSSKFLDGVFVEVPLRRGRYDSADSRGRIEIEMASLAFSPSRSIAALPLAIC